MNAVAERDLMVAAKMISKGRITIPASVRSDLGLKPGDRVEFLKTPEGYYAMTVRKPLDEKLAEQLPGDRSRSR